MKTPSLTAIFCIFGFAAAHSKMISAQPRLLDFNIAEGKVNCLADFNEPFRWLNTRYDSVQTFPSFLPWLPEIPNTLRISGSGTADYRLGDIMFAGTLHDLESNTMEIGLMGWLLPLQGIFNPELGLLKFDDLDFIPFFPTPRCLIEQSSDLTHWEPVSGLVDLPKEYRWPEPSMVSWTLPGSASAFFRIRMIP